ncbi:hypothetical protein ACEPPN_002515 [Leptodophora sp. 'Broadleaf-Isolate-01']
MRLNHLLQTTIYLQPAKEDDDTAKTGTIQVTATEKSRDSSPFSIASTTTSQLSTNTTTPRTSISTNSSWSTCKGSPIVPINKPANSVDFILNDTGALPHQESPFGKDSHRYLRQARSPTRSSTTRISQIDLNGYRFLAKPLQVEFNNILGRWMFSSEIKTRSIVAPMCKSLKCMEADMSVCDKTVNLDEKMECMRRQTVEEIKESRVLLEERQGKILVFEEEEEYVPLLTYLGVDFGYA